MALSEQRGSSRQGAERGIIGQWHHGLTLANKTLPSRPRQFGLLSTVTVHLGRDHGFLIHHFFFKYNRSHI